MEFLFFRIFLVIFCVDVTIQNPVNNGKISALRAALDELGYAEKDITTKTERELVAALTELAGKDTKESLSKTCIQEVCGEKKKFDRLTPFEQGEVIGKMDMKHKDALMIKAKLTPRMLIDDLEGDFGSEYQTVASQFIDESAKLNANVNKIRGQIQNFHIILGNRPNMSAEERQDYENQLRVAEKNLDDISKKANDYAYYRSPLPSEAREENIERRVRKWHWKYYYGKPHRNMQKLQERVQTEYIKYKNSKDFETYPRTLEEFTMGLFEAIAEAHDTGYGVVHVDLKISAEEEFPLLHFLGDDYLDLHLTMFVNTLGRKKPFDPEIFNSRNRRRSSTLREIMMNTESTSTA